MYVDYISRHVHRGGAQSLVPSRHPAAGELSRGGQGQEPDLRGRALAPPAPHEASGLEIVRSWPHGHIAAVLGTVRRLDLERLLAPKATPARALVVAMLVQRLVAPGSKLATARGLARETRSSTLSDVLALPAVDEDDLYSALDWLLPRQG